VFAVVRAVWVYGATMLRPRARVGRAPAAVPTSGLVPGLLLALLLALAGCGSADNNNDKAAAPDKAEVACRAKWKDLESKVNGRDSLTNPSALAQRWNSITATLEYYASSASSKDCGKTIEDQQKAMDALASFSTRLAPYDMEQRLDQVKADAQRYATSPRPPAPKASPSTTKKANTKKTKKAKPPPARTAPAVVAAALRSLTTQAPVATQQQGPGWQQASVIELSDAAAVAKALKDLAFLSSQSPAYRACTVALAQISSALKPTGH
jgi:hypothetical protein